MNKFSLGLLLILLFSSTLTTAQAISNKKDSVSYSIGLITGQNLRSQGLTEINVEVLAQAISDALQNEGYAIDKVEAQSVYTKCMKELKENKSKEVKMQGEKFLEENGKKPEVTTTASGLQYEVMKSGTGMSPSATDKVKTHYHGMLTDGTVFDSSVDRGEPISFPVNGVIKGWQEALQLMKVGDKWKLTIPSDLAYGARGAGNVIPPFATLIFEVELLGIE